MSKYIKKIIIPAAIAATLLILRFVVFFLAVVPSGSMIPTIQIGDQLVVNKIDRNFSKGDIVVFKYPDDESVYYIKRIIGEPGDKVEIKDGKTYVNEEIINEPYLAEEENGDFGPYNVPESSYFMLGDNRNYSKDARFWTNKYVEEDKIIGKAFYIWFPFNRIRTLQ